jgi:acyl-CoA synthetase (AMP-forming)/AMP-acid ligase II
VIEAAAGRELVACGELSPEHALAILDPESAQPLPRGRVGEIYVSGPSVTHGYHENADSTRESFLERGGRVWLRTGDLGFEHDGQLYIAGRYKDVILVRGQNLYPQDIERSIEDELEVVRKGRTAAFAVESNGEEGIAVATEISQRHRELLDPHALCLAISEVVARAHGQAPCLVLLLEPGALPITSSGKLQRGLCRKRWERRALAAFAHYEDGELKLGVV